MDEMNNTPVTPENEAPAPQPAPAPETKYCPRCGKALSANSVFCGGCGTHLASGNAAPAHTPAPADQSPLKTSDYFVMMLLFSIPLVGLILALIWGFSSDANENRKNFSRANLIWYAISAVLCIVWVIFLFVIIGFAVGATESSMAYPSFSMIFPFF